jgi:hypothetical protein
MRVAIDARSGIAMFFLPQQAGHDHAQSLS